MTICNSRNIFQLKNWKYDVKNKYISKIRSIRIGLDGALKYLLSSFQWQRILALRNLFSHVPFAGLRKYYYVKYNHTCGKDLVTVSNKDRTPFATLNNLRTRNIQNSAHVTLLITRKRLLDGRFPAVQRTDESPTLCIYFCVQWL